MTRTPRRNGSQPDPATVINLDERRNTQALGGNRRPQRSSSRTEETADCRHPMPGSDECWENALVAFKEYLVPGAAGRDAGDFSPVAVELARARRSANH